MSIFCPSGLPHSFRGNLIMARVPIFLSPWALLSTLAAAVGTRGLWTPVPQAPIQFF